MGSTSKYRQNFSHTTWTLEPITRLGRRVRHACPSLPPTFALQRQLIARPASITASLEPTVRRADRAARVVVAQSLGVEEVGHHRHAPRLDRRGHRVLVLVDHVLVERLGHQLLGLGVHPGRDEGGEVEPRAAVEHQLVVDEAVGRFGGPSTPRACVARGSARWRAARCRPAQSTMTGCASEPSDVPSRVGRSTNGRGPGFPRPTWVPGGARGLVRTGSQRGRGRRRPSLRPHRAAGRPPAGRR